MNTENMITAFVGLGNSGKEYQKTFHNVGAFLAPVLCTAMVQAGIEREPKVYPVQGYMNESGVPVRRWLEMNNVHAGEFLVIHDDSDLLVGDFKLSFGGGSAGHKGIESIISVLGTADFWRLRIGVRSAAEVVRRKAADFVLNTWSAAEEEAFLSVCEKATPIVRNILLDK